MGFNSGFKGLTFMVSRQDFGRRTLFEDFQPFLNILKRDGLENLIQTVSLPTRSWNTRSPNVGSNSEYQHRLFCCFPQSLQRTVGISTLNITPLYLARLFQNLPILIRFRPSVNYSCKHPLMG